MKRLFTSEAVTEGHPDKICDYIADSILTEALRQDKKSKMAVEATIKDNLLLIYGEATTKANLDYEALAKRALLEIGYKEDFDIILKVGAQSPEINTAVVNRRTKAGDQGIMFGYACDETKEYMPLSHSLATKLAKRLADLRKSVPNSILRPDGKTQVTVSNEDGQIFIDTIVISSQHKESAAKEELENLIKTEVIDKVIDSSLITVSTKIYINNSGSFTLGGPWGDSGTTGRKIVCDTYGGAGKVGGGCLSSKDPSKVDRSAAYYARYVAKNVVMHGLARRCEIEVSYVIGKEEALSIGIETFNTNKISDEEILNWINKHFDFRVQNIIDELDLLNFDYRQISNYGHFGRCDLNLPWEMKKDIKE